MEPADGQALVGHTDVPSVFSVRVICSLVVLLFFFCLCVLQLSQLEERQDSPTHTHTDTQLRKRWMAS